MKYFKKLLKILFAFSVLILLLPLLLNIPIFFNKNYYRETIIENVERYSDYKLDLEKFELSAYPSLRIHLKNVALRTKEKETLLLKVEEVNLVIFVLAVLSGGKLQIDDISLKNGVIDIPSFVNSFPDSNEDNKQEEMVSQDIIKLLHNRLRIKQILLENLKVKVKPFHYLIYHDLKINELKLSYESFLDSTMSFNIDYGKTNITLTGIAGISPEQLDLKSLFYDVELIVTNLPIYEYSQYLKDFPRLNTNDTKLNLKIEGKKEKDTLILENNIDLTINSIGYKNKKNVNIQIGPITLLGNIDYPLLSQKIYTKDLQLTIPNLFHLKIDSDLTISYRPQIKAHLSSSFVNIMPILELVEALSLSKEKKEMKNSDSENTNRKELNIYVDLKYFANRISYENHLVQNVYLDTILNNSALQYKVEILKLVEGNFRLSGEANIQKGISTNASLEIENVNMEKFTNQFLEKKMIEGTLFTYVKFQTDNIYGEKDFFKNLSLTGTTNLKNGILLDRADILYPIRFLNKIIPSENKLNTNISKFNYIDIDYTIKNHRFKMKNLNMQGKIFNTTGTAEIGLDNPTEDINANLVVSSRLMSAGIKIPMTYSKSSYVPFSIDKVWLASVYTGMVMGGPVGAMIGSALSERAGAAFKTIQNKSEVKFKENTKKLFSE